MAMIVRDNQDDDQMFTYLVIAVTLKRLHGAFVGANGLMENGQCLDVTTADCLVRRRDKHVHET